MQTSDARKRGQEAVQETFNRRWQVGSTIHVDAGFDVVAKPEHYTHSKIEVWDAIEAWGLNYFKGAAVKYIARAGRKFNEVEDIEKAIAYLSKELENLKASALSKPKQGESPDRMNCKLNETKFDGYMFNGKPLVDTKDAYGRSFGSALEQRVEALEKRPDPMAVIG